jgi:hypothetical protein
MLAANELGHDVLSAWFVAGYSREKTQGWREYFLSGISELQITDAVLLAPVTVTIRRADSIPYTLLSPVKHTGRFPRTCAKSREEHTSFGGRIRIIHLFIGNC